MKFLQKLYLLLILIIWFIGSINQAQAIFHDEGWSYYLQNSTTWEIKSFHLERDLWNWWLSEIYNRKIDKNKIPIKNYFNNWDLVWYNYQRRYKNFQCKWDANWLKLNVKTGYWINNSEPNPCIQIPKIDKKFSINDLWEFDKILYYINFLFFVSPALILSILVNFFVILPILRYILKSAKNLKPVYILYISFLLSISYEIISIIFWFSKIQISWNLFWAFINMFNSLIKLPFYIWWVIIFLNKFLKFKFLYLKSKTLNNIILFILKFLVFFILFTIEISPLWFFTFHTKYFVIFITIVLLFIFFLKRKIIENYFNNNYLSNKKKI